jgi:hypothetical protein
LNITRGQERRAQQQKLIDRPALDGIVNDLDFILHAESYAVPGKREGQQPQKPRQ